MKGDIYLKIQKLESLLTELSGSLNPMELKRYTAKQYFKAENLNLAEGATLTINMNNALFSQKLISQCQQIVNDIKPYIPHNGNGLYEIIEQYIKDMVSNALLNNGFKYNNTAKELKITYRQLRYITDKHDKYFKQLKKEKENYHGSSQEKNAELGTAG